MRYVMLLAMLVGCGGRVVVDQEAAAAEPDPGAGGAAAASNSAAVTAASVGQGGMGGTAPACTWSLHNPCCTDGAAACAAIHIPDCVAYPEKCGDTCAVQEPCWNGSGENCQAIKYQAEGYPESVEIVCDMP